MSRTPELPDLTKLSSAEKDQLIVTLYDTLLAVEGQAPASAPAGGRTAPSETAGPAAPQDLAGLRSRIGASPPSRRAQTPVTPASGWAVRLLNARALQVCLIVVGLGYAADWTIGWVQRRQLDSQKQAALELRSAAFDGLYVELVRVTYEPDGRTYRATMTMQTSRQGAPLFVMMSPPRVFVQVGATWREMPSQPPRGTTWGVVKLDDARDFSVLFQTDVKDWAELIPGYMHVRIDSQMLISRSSAPKDDIVERNNVFYVYLKPQGADDETIKRRSRFPGTPPVFIPMPPH